MTLSTKDWKNERGEVCPDGRELPEEVRRIVQKQPLHNLGEQGSRWEAFYLLNESHE
jgi:hypothetical protein